MRMSHLPLVTQRDFPSNATCASHRWLLRGGFMVQHAAGIYSLGPLLCRSLDKVKAIIDEHMTEAGASKVLFPAIHPKELWEQSGRWDGYVASGTMYTTKGRQESEFALAPTAEEIAVDFIRNTVKSSKSFPLTVFQHGHKFRDELRPRSGLLRGREFQMMDGYSFSNNKEETDAVYASIRKAYFDIFGQIELSCVPVSASNGDMGGSDSEEFMAFSDAGEDLIWIDDTGTAINDEMREKVTMTGNVRSFKGIEVGHIFKLGSKYSEAMNLTGPQGPLHMGCYGIGTSRVLAAIVEQHHDDRGICWPKSVAPYQVHVLQLTGGDDVDDYVQGLYGEFKKIGMDVLLDDRSVSAGVKFNDADILGMPYSLTIGKALRDGKVEIKNRKTGEKELVTQYEVASYFQR